MVLTLNRAIVVVATIVLLQTVYPVRAGNCLSKAEGIQLISDTVHWAFAMPVDSDCLQGLRGGAMLIEDVKIVEPPSAGSLSLTGSGFIYKAPAAEANDHFKLRVSGENRRMRGTSEVVVDVSIRR
jgi:hypothetical protein